MPQQTKGMEARLTIAIPTFNRAAKLRAQLDRLAPQLTPEVRCFVCDNASTDETRQVVEKYNSRGIAYTCAFYNGGAGRNMLRCFEECQTEWLWVLCDDDLVSAHAVSDALALVRDQPCDYIHTLPLLAQCDSEIVVSDVGRLLKHYNIGRLLWMSLGLYKMSSFRPLLWLYNDSISTWGPHLVMVLALLERQGGKVLLSPTGLISESNNLCRWSTLDFIVRFSHLPDYLVRPEHQKVMAEQIWLQCVTGALLAGLRETSGPVQIRKWQQIQRSVGRNLRAYHARPLWVYVARNWFRPGHRRPSLVLLQSAMVLAPLRWCPLPLFRPLLKILSPLLKALPDEFVSENLSATDKEYVSTY
jgi:glycosyltransferase involved in cell wall biosynthesis